MTAYDGKTLSDPVILSIDANPLTLNQCIRALKSSGSLPATIGTILRQYVVQRALQNTLEPDPSDADLRNRPAPDQETESLRRQISEELSILEDRLVDDFQRQNQALTREALGEYLALRGQDVESLRRQIRRDLALDILKHKVAAPQMEGHFIERAPFLGKVTLSRLSVSGRNNADQLITRLASEPERFSQAAFECARSLDGGFEVSTSLWVDLPEAVREAAADAGIGELLGPHASPAEDVWWIFRVEARWPASLRDPQVRHALREELFEQWIAAQLESSRIELALPAGAELERW